jgi:uncharacterized protein YjbJ (UPF0337 family)
MTHDSSGEARKGLVDSIAGKAKEIAGALTGKSDLVQKGQVQQQAAATRREANSEDAVADAQLKRTADEQRDVQQHLAAERRRADDAAAEQRRSIEREADAEIARGNDAARRREVSDRENARVQAADQLHETAAEAQTNAVDAVRTERAAKHERDELVREAAVDELRAADLRATAAQSEGDHS